MGCLESRDKVEIQTTLEPMKPSQNRAESVLQSAIAEINFDEPKEDSPLESVKEPRSRFDQLFAAEQGQLKEFQEAVGELKSMLEIHNIGEGLNDAYLYRFLKSTKFNALTAATKLKNHLEWKKQLAEKEFVFWESDAVQDIFPHGYHKTDKLGRPVLICAVRDFEQKNLLSITKMDRLELHFSQLFEVLVDKIFKATSEVLSKCVNSQIIVIDLKDFKLKVTEVKQLVKMLANFSSDQFPETVDKILIVNAPEKYQNYWKQVGQLLNTVTAGKVTFVGSEYKKALSNLIENENIPDFLGGESDTQNLKLLRKNIGPWNTSNNTISFPHEDNSKIANVTDEEKQVLAAGIETYWNNRLSQTSRSSVQGQGKFSEKNRSSINGEHLRTEDTVSSSHSMSQSVLSDI